MSSYHVVIMEKFGINSEPRILESLTFTPADLDDDEDGILDNISEMVREAVRNNEGP